MATLKDTDSSHTSDKQGYIREWEENISQAKKILENPYDHELTHRGNKLANHTAYLAVTEQDGEYIIDEEIIENSDKSRKIRNIAERLVENKVDGRKRLEKMIEEAEKVQNTIEGNGNLSRELTYNDNSTEDKDTTYENPGYQNQGGENQMTDEESVEYTEEDSEDLPVLSDLENVGDEEAARAVSNFFSYMKEEHGVKQRLADTAEEFADQYLEALEQRNLAEDERDEYREMLLRTADTGAKYLEGDIETLEEIETTLEAAMDQNTGEVNLYNPGDEVYSPLEDMEEWVDDLYGDE